MSKKFSNFSLNEERKNINQMIVLFSIPLTENRLKIFKDSELKEQFSDVDELNLRIVNIILEKENEKTGEIEIEIEILLTNLSRNNE